MSVELEWEVVDRDGRWPKSPLSAPSSPRRSRRVWLALLGVIGLALAVGAGALAWAYRARLDQVAGPVRAAARLEAQAVADNDRAMFMALQDPDDLAWRKVQERRFGQLERVGMPEFGWQAAGAAPQLGEVSLDPGGVRLDVTYRFSVTQPLPDGPLSITLRVPQFYEQVSSGWVRTRPAPELWKQLQNKRGERVRVYYFERDADLIEPLIPQLDDVAGHTCSALACPDQAVITFEGAVEALTPGSGSVYGFTEGATLRLPSPHLLGLPADDPSRNEFYRAVKMRLVQALVGRAAGTSLKMEYLLPRGIGRWELARAGLVSPFLTRPVTQALAAAVQTGAWLPLETLSLYPADAGLTYRPPDETMLPLALAFAGEQFGSTAIARMIPALRQSLTFGEAISATFQVNPQTLDLAWWQYVRKQAGRPIAETAPPDGELALACSQAGAGPAAWRVHADGTGLAQVAPSATCPAWSPDGSRLAYLKTDGGRLVVVDAADQSSQPMPALAGTELGWLPDGRLWVAGTGWDVGPDGAARKSGAYLVNLDSGRADIITGTNHTWSPDGSRVAYLSSLNLSLWTAAANGRDPYKIAPGVIASTENSPQQIAPGYEMAWSPDGAQLAFIGRSPLDPPGLQNVMGTKIRVINMTSGAERDLARVDDLRRSITGQQASYGGLDSLAWSPDGSRLAIGMRWLGAGAAILDANSGEVRAQLRGDWSGASWPSGQPWSPDGRYLAARVERGPLSYMAQQGTLVVWDIQSDQSAALPGDGWAWSPDGQWLAVRQRLGVLLVRPDMSAMHWLDLPNCSYVSWRPGH